MTVKTLSTFVSKVTKSGDRVPLSKSATNKFYSEFREAMAPVVQEVRDQEKRAFEEARHISLA